MPVNTKPIVSPNIFQHLFKVLRVRCFFILPLKKSSNVQVLPVNVVRRADYVIERVLAHEFGVLVVNVRRQPDFGAEPDGDFGGVLIPQRVKFIYIFVVINLVWKRVAV